MSEELFYNLFVPYRNQENYLSLDGQELRIDSFVAMSLNFHTQKVSYTVSIEIPDATIGKWFKSKKIKPGYGDKFYLSLGGDYPCYVKLAKVKNKIFCSPEVTFEQNSQDRIRAKIKIDKADVVKSIEAGSPKNNLLYSI